MNPPATRLLGKLPLVTLTTLATLAFAFAFAFAARAQELKAHVDRDDAKYATGQPAKFSVEITGDAAAVTNITYVLKQGGRTVVGKGSAREATATLEEPGTILAEFRARTTAGKELKALAGAAFSLECIKPSAPRPDDFDTFWSAKIKELNAAPMNPKIEPGPSPKPGVEYSKLTMDGFRNTKIHGQLARPKRDGKFPALLIVQWAGVYGLDKSWATLPAAEGFLALNISAHDLPIDESAGFYQAQSDGPLKNYTAIGKEDREKSYFLRMYLSAYRAADYLTQRPDWDGKHLVVSGTSQGGLQTLMLAGLHPKVTAAMANVPAGCDQTGILAGRSCGWPALANWLQGDEQKKLLEVARYYDVVNFASNIKCPILVSAGMLDETCPPAGVIAAANQSKGPREILVLPRSDHHGRGNAQKAMFERMGAWRQAVLKGQALPPK